MKPLRLQLGSGNDKWGDTGMSDVTDRVTALTLLTEYLQPAVAPTLTTTASSGEVDVILDRNKRASTWTAGAAYFVNDVVLPTVRNGHRYRAIVSGVSAATTQSGVQYVIVTAGGSYTSVPGVTFSGGGGAGAAGTAIVANGMVVAVLLTNRGTGYTSAPSVGFSAGSAAATASILGAEPFWPRIQGARIGDGSSGVNGYVLTWIEDGSQYDSIYDVRQAAHEGWRLRAEKAAQFVQAGDLHMQEIYDHSVSEMNRFSSLSIR